MNARDFTEFHALVEQFSGERGPWPRYAAKSMSATAATPTEGNGTAIPVRAGV